MQPPRWMIGPRGLLWIAGIGLIGLLPLAVLAPTQGALTLATAAIFAAFLVHRRASTLTVSHDKLSGEIDVLSQHLLKVEALASAAAARARPASPPASTPPAQTAALAADIGEVTTEIGLLSGIVRELAAVVSVQAADITRLKAAAPIEAQAEKTRILEALSAPATPARAAAAVSGERTALPDRPPVLPPRPPEPASTQPPADEPPRDHAREATLVQAFDGEGLEVWLQPVVTLPQRKIVAYEAVARLRLAPGGAAEILSPETFLPVLERHGRTTALDRSMLKGAAMIAHHLQGRGSKAAIAYSLSRLSLFEPDFLRSLRELVGADADLSGGLGIALPQASWRSLDAEQTAVLAALRGRLGFILDRPTDLRFDAAMLAEFGIDQVKVPASLLLRPGPDAQPDIAVEDLVTVLGRSNIRLAACDVEYEKDVPDLIDLNVPLAQGPIFAKPRAVRVEVLASAPAVPISAAPSISPGLDTPPPRRPFREFLRRAV